MFEQVYMVIAGAETRVTEASITVPYRRPRQEELVRHGRARLPIHIPTQMTPPFRMMALLRTQTITVGIQTGTTSRGVIPRIRFIDGIHAMLRSVSVSIQ